MVVLAVRCLARMRSSVDTINDQNDSFSFIKSCIWRRACRSCRSRSQSESSDPSSVSDSSQRFRFIETSFSVPHDSVQEAAGAVPHDMFPASRCRFIEAAGVLAPTHGPREERFSDKRRKKAPWPILPTAETLHLDKLCGCLFPQKKNKKKGNRW